MRKKGKGTKVKENIIQRKEKDADQEAESILFIDENSEEVQVRTGEGSPRSVRENVTETEFKDNSDRVIAVVDKNPEKSSSYESVAQDDDAPEDVSWKATKESALRERTLEREIILDAKRKEKQMRIERNEKLCEQKERKRAREYSRLPMEILHKVARQHESEETLLSQTMEHRSHVTFDNSSEDEQDESGEQKEEHGTVQEETAKIKVLVLPRETKKPKKIQQSANSFLQEHLFGDRIQRISASGRSDLMKKSHNTLVPARNFSKKSW
ncbi:uncharacterized protein LOC111331335 [Stylophora pistillata]|uniref:uncharacterized protein LOC111331335 n=1 Tax=Stylophora pistillata TaxID=50429 RepID=UPI000C03C10E|nr:uncharacterized protein LOC111331335 [Stylophora pistillata]